MSRFLRPTIARMAGYVPGEQPRDGGFTKLNTNENPYPPSPRVKSAIVEAVTDRLRLYPDPTLEARPGGQRRLGGLGLRPVGAGDLEQPREDQRGLQPPPRPAPAGDGGGDLPGRRRLHVRPLVHPGPGDRAEVHPPRGDP